MPLLRRTLLAGAGFLAARGACAQSSAASDGILTLLLAGEPVGFVPGMGDPNADIAGSKIFQGLLRFSPAFEPLPELARSWTVSSDGRTTIFKLRRGVTWHDGQPFTADDVLFSVMERPGQLPATARAVIEHIKAAAAPDPETVLFTLDAPFEPFLLVFEVTQCPIVPAHLFRGPAGAPADPPVGTGPFRLPAWRPGQSVRLIRHEHYWRPALPLLAAIAFKSIPDHVARLQTLAEAGPVMASGAGLAPRELAPLRESPELVLATHGWEFTAPLTSLVLNHRVPPLGDIRVRRAISLATDRDYILRRIWSGFGKPASGPVASVSPLYDRSLPALPYDPRKAAALLGEAGLRPNGQGIRLTLHHLVQAGDETALALAQYLQAALRQIGMLLVLESVGAEAWAARLLAREFESAAVTQDQSGDPSIGLEPVYVRQGPANLAGYQNDQVDQLLARARSISERNMRKAMWAEAQRILVAEVAQVWLIEVQSPSVMGRNVRFGTALATGMGGSFDDLTLAEP